MKIHHLTVANALASLKSGLARLSDAEAQRRLVEFGRKGSIQDYAARVESVSRVCA
jgi:hypothetical protein